MFKNIKHLAEYAGLSSIIFLFERIPITAAEWIATRLADIAFRMAASRRKTAIENIIRTGIASSPSEAARIARASFRHFPIMIIESLKAGKEITPENWRNYVETDISPETMALLEDPEQALIMCTGHLGSWEVCGQILSYIKPVVTIVRKMNNPYTNKLMDRRQTGDRLTALTKNDTGSTHFLSALRSGKALALLIDQHARDGIMINFFGTPASSHTSLARLHLLTNVPIIFFYFIRTGLMSYKFCVTDPLTYKKTGKKKHDIKAVLELINNELEKAITKHPEQYLWAHKRWKKKPDKAN